MEELLTIDGSSVYEFCNSHNNYKNIGWIPTDRKSQISLDFLNFPLTLEYNEFSCENFSKAILRKLKMLGNFYLGNQALKLKQIDKYRYITNNSDTTKQREKDIEAVPCTKLVEYSKLNTQHLSNLLKSRTNSEGKTIWFLEFSSSEEAAPYTPAEYYGILSVTYEFDFADMSCIFTAFLQEDISQ